MPPFCIMRNHRMSNIIKSFGKIFFMATPPSPSSRPFVPAVFFTHCVFFPDSTLEQMKSDRFIHSNGTTFFCKFSKEYKFEEFQRIRTALCAICVEVVTVCSKMNMQDLQKLTVSMCAAKRKTISQTTISIQDQISTDTKQRTLVVV